MTAGIFGPFSIKVQVELDDGRAVSVNRSLHDTWGPAVIGPSDVVEREMFLESADRSKVALIGRSGIAGNTVQERQVRNSGRLQHGDRFLYFFQGSHPGGEHHRLSCLRARFEKGGPEQLVGCDLEKINMRSQQFDLRRIERCATEPDTCNPRGCGQIGEELLREFPSLPFMDRGHDLEDLRRKQFLQSKQLELDAVAADFGGRTDEPQAAVQTLLVIGRDFGDEAYPFHWSSAFARILSRIAGTYLLA